MCAWGEGRKCGKLGLRISRASPKGAPPQIPGTCMGPEVVTEGRGRASCTASSPSARGLSPGLGGPPEEVLILWFGRLAMESRQSEGESCRSR